MRLLILSDLHVEHAPFDAPSGSYDAVILAGDIHNGVKALQWARQTFERHPIIQIAGNHEYYDEVFQPCRQEMHATAKSLGIHLLDDSSLLLNGVEFLGTTLWTDFRVFDRPGRALRLDAVQAMQANKGLLADYFAIRFEAPGSGAPKPRSFEPEDSLALHQQARGWLDRALARTSTIPRVVISHHLPSWNSVSQRFANSVTNAAFVSDLDDLVAHSDWWIHGHTHSSHRYRVGGATVLSNPRGYPKRGKAQGFENPDFRPDLIIEI